MSEIVRPSLEAAQLLNVSAPVAAAATRVRVDPSGDVVMTATDQAQHDEDANLRKIVAQLHVNLGHPSNDALARAIRLSGGRRWTEFGQWHLISSCLRTSLEKTVCF